jgi:hypothetical protein
MVSDSNDRYYLILDATFYFLKVWRLSSTPDTDRKDLCYVADDVIDLVATSLTCFRCHSYTVQLSLGVREFSFWLGRVNTQSLEEFVCREYLHLLTVDVLRKLVGSLGGNVPNTSASWMECLEAVLDSSSVSDEVKESAREKGRKKVAKRKPKPKPQQPGEQHEGEGANQDFRQPRAHNCTLKLSCRDAPPHPIYSGDGGWVLQELRV